MSRFCFALSNVETRRDGVIESDSFSDAVDELGRQVTVSKGDTLEIGVYGFPPDLAAQIAVTTIRATPTNVERIRLVAFDTATHDLLESALQA